MSPFDLAREISNRQGNDVCAECPERDTSYVSFLKPVATKETLCVFLCEGCHKHHTRLGVHFCDVKSLSTAQKASNWSKRDVAMLQKTGNQYVNSFYEAMLVECADFRKDKEINTPDPQEESKLRLAFVKNKYIRRKYFSMDKYHEEQKKRDTETSGQLQVPATPKGLRRKTLGAFTSTRQKLAMLTNSKENTSSSQQAQKADLFDLGAEAESESDNECNNTSTRGLDKKKAPPMRGMLKNLKEDMKTISTRSLSLSRSPSTKSLQEKGRDSHNNDNILALPSDLVSSSGNKPQEAPSQAGLAMFLTLQTDNEKRKGGKKKLGRCQSVSGTLDTPKASKAKLTLTKNDSEPKLMLYGDKVAMGKVDATDDVQKIKAAKLAKKSRKARRRASTMSSTPSATTMVDVQPQHPSTKEKRDRDSPSPTSVREEARMCQSLCEKRSRDKEDKDEKDEVDEPPKMMSHRERLQNVLSSSRADRGARCGSTRGGEPPLLDTNRGHSHVNNTHPSLVALDPILDDSSNQDVAAPHNRRRRGTAAAAAADPLGGSNHSVSSRRCHSVNARRRRPSMAATAAAGGGGEDPLGGSNHSVGSRRHRRPSMTAPAGVDPLGGSNHSVNNSSSNNNNNNRRTRGVAPRRNHHQDPLSVSEQDTSANRSSRTRRTAGKSLLGNGSDPGNRSDGVRRASSSKDVNSSKPSRSKPMRRVKTMNDGSDPHQLKKKGSSRRSTKRPPSSSSKKMEAQPDFNWSLNKQNETEEKEKEVKKKENKYKSLDNCVLSTGYTAGDLDLVKGGGDTKNEGGAFRPCDTAGSLRETQSSSSLRMLAMKEAGTKEAAASAFAGLTKCPSAQVMIGATKRSSATASSLGSGNNKNAEFKPRKGRSKRSMSMVDMKKDKPYENQILKQWKTGYWPSEEEEAKAKLEEDAASGKKKSSRRSSTRKGTSRAQSLK